MNAIWYRHWIEMRGGLLVASVAMALLALTYPVFVLTGAARTTGAGRALQPMALAMAAEPFAAWAPHVWICAVASSIVGFFLWGTGIRPNSLLPNHPSVTYSLTLPVARVRLLWSRFAAGVAAVTLLFAGLLVVNGLVLFSMGHSVPLAAMAASSGLAALFVASVMAVMALVGIWDENQLGWMIPAALLAAYLGAWQPLMAFIASPRVPWIGIASLVATAAAALSAGVLVARRKDFC